VRGAAVRIVDCSTPANEDIVNYTGCKDEIAGGLTKMLWTASQLDEEADFEDLLEAIRVVRPGWRGAGTVMAWRYVRRQAWRDARRVLEDDEVEAKRSGLHAALMAVCLFGLEDPLWHSYARSAVEQRESVEAAKIGARLLERAAKLDASVQTTVAADAPAAASAAQPDGGGFSSAIAWVRA
jgi:type III secretion protein HrpB1